MLTTGSTDLPVGIGFADTAHDFRVERCFMRHFQWKRRDNQYWNGDGFSTERGNARFLFRQCEIGRAHVRTPVTNAHLVCRLRLEKKKTTPHLYQTTYIINN